MHPQSHALKGTLKREGAESLFVDIAEDQEQHAKIGATFHFYLQLQTPGPQSKSESGEFCKVETPYHDNDLILTPIISPQSGWQ
jgi:hypothetical protein